MILKKHSGWRRWHSTIINLASVFALLMAVSFLPADTSLSHVRDSGVLKFCVPEHYPPFVTGNPDKPGYDIELADAIAKRIGVRLIVNTVPTIGRDFNPRNWMVTRGQCDMLGGGVADTARTRNFMQTVPTHIRVGWMLLSPDSQMPAAGSAIVVMPGSSGLDRLALSGWLRRNELRPIMASGFGDELAAVEVGRAAGLIAENFTACGLLKNSKHQPPLKAEWLPLPNPKVEDSIDSLAFSLWKGDLTLKQAVEHAMQNIESDGVTDKLRDIYLGGSDRCQNVVAENKTIEPIK
ncbi:MAG: substrate-binding periplasmic protein [Phyllobacterium sp.]